MKSSGNGSRDAAAGLAAPGLAGLGRRFIEASVRKALVSRKLKPVTLVLGKYQKLTVCALVAMTPLKICKTAEAPLLPGPVPTICKLALPACLTAVLIAEPEWFPMAAQGLSDPVSRSPFWKKFGPAAAVVPATKFKSSM